MNIHIITKQKFTNKLIELMEKYPASSNIVYTYDVGEGFDCAVSSCVKEISNLSEVDLSLLTPGDKLFVHGFYYRQIIFYLYRNIKKLRKGQLVLICWGGDIYDARALLAEGGLHLRTRLTEFLKKRVIKSCNVFMTFACADIEILENYYGANGKQFDCLYPSNAHVEFLDNLKLQKKESSVCRVLLGNSATRSNQHMQALKILERFAGENIEIICPLSYGDRDYADEVISYGKKLFDSKFIPILNYMNVEEYSNLLNSIQVAVFNHNRQQGTGNIEIISYLEKKIYLRSDTTTWKHYVERDQCKFFDVSSIDNMSFSQFQHIDNSDAQFNVDYFGKIWDINYVKSLWDDVMSYNVE